MRRNIMASEEESQRLKEASANATDAADKLLAEYERQTADVKARSEVWQRHLEDYTGLKDTLESIPDRAVHSSTMIPMGKKAYMEGSLVHTNEIMVLLGDNWFAERSAKQAAEVAQRRIDKCTEMLEGLDKELALIEGWRNQAAAGGVVADDDGGVDIREPYDEAAEAEWARHHKERVKAEAAAKASMKSAANDDDDADLFRRLDELELEEQLDEHIARQEAKKQAAKAIEDKKQSAEPDTQLSGDHDESDLSESPPLTDDEEEEEEDESSPADSNDQYRTVPDVTSLRQSRFSVTEVISEDDREVNLNRATLNTSHSHQTLLRPNSENITENEKSGGDHLAQVQPRKRRVSFGSISERLFLKDETTAGMTGAATPSSSGEMEEGVYATVTGAAATSVSQPAAPPPDTSPSSSSSSPPVDVPTIFFSHHSEVVEGGGGGAVGGGGLVGGRVPHDPSDFVRLYGAAGSPTRLKSILKPSGSSHSLSSVDEDRVVPTQSPFDKSFGRFAVSPAKSLASSVECVSPSGSCGRFSVSPSSVGSAADLDTSTNSRFSVSSVHDDSPFPPTPHPLGVNPPGAKVLGDHPVRNVVVENSPSTAPPPPTEGGVGGARKQSRFKLSRVQI